MSDDVTTIARVQARLGICELALERVDVARPLLERALAHLPDQSLLRANALFALARARWHDQEGRDEALALADQSKRILIGLGQPQSTRAKQLADWLDRREASQD